MPRKEETISIQALDTNTALAIANQAFKNLNWTPQFAGPDKLLAITQKKWNANPQQIIVGVSGGQLNISSEITNNQSFDLGGKNKKNLLAFKQAFEAVESSIDEATIEANQQDIITLREDTQRAAEENDRLTAEVDEVMHLSQRNLIITYAIIAINLLVFILMAVNGVSLFEPGAIDVIRWGGNYAPLTLDGEWWRLLTNIFEHIGIVHILFNMYALYMIGIYLEPMLGKVRYAVAYICTGIIASLASLWWHSTNPTASAGASGAIFGLYGVFLALLSTSLIPKKVRAALLQSIGVFVIFNLFYGIKSGIDNAAHIGGLVSGLVIGYAYYLTLIKKFAVKSVLITSAALLLATTGITYAYLYAAPRTDSKTIQQVRNEITNSGYPDTDEYERFVKQYSALETAALVPFNNTTMLTDAELAKQLTTVSEPKWQEANTLVKNAKTLNLSSVTKVKIQALENYTHQRLKEINLIQEIGKGNEKSVEELNLLRTQMKATIDSLQAL